MRRVANRIGQARSCVHCLTASHVLHNNLKAVRQRGLISNAVMIIYTYTY